MDLHLEGCRAVVVGVGGALGTAIADHLMREGVDVLVVSDTNVAGTSAADKEADLDPSRQSTAREMSVDLSGREAPASIGTSVRAELGGIDILVNAGPAYDGRSSDDVSSAMWRGFTLPCMVTRELLPDLRRSGNGRVINLISPDEPAAASAQLAASAALRVWSKGLSRDIGRDSITVNGIVPGSPVARGAGASLDGVAPMVAMLASPRSSYVTGEVLHVDDGRRHHA